MDDRIETERTASEARQGAVSGRVTTVLVVSALLAGGAMLLVWLITAFALT